jgi:hypothetical protein
MRSGGGFMPRACARQVGAVVNKLGAMRTPPQLAVATPERRIGALWSMCRHRDIQSDPRRTTGERALPVLGGLVYGALGWGGSCDNNVNSTPINRVSACGPSIRPSLIASWNTGIQRTLLYGVGDIVYYPTLSVAAMGGRTSLGGTAREAALHQNSAPVAGDDGPRRRSLYGSSVRLRSLAHGLEPRSILEWPRRRCHWCW